MRRRGFLKGAGVVTVLVVGGGVWRAYSQGVFSVGEGPAYEPWKDWQKVTKDGQLSLVRAAILAASPHNTQPWVFRLTDSTIHLYIDTRRNVGALDPYLREEHIGMGCALENLMLAASANGYAASATLMAGKLGPIPAEPNPHLAEPSTSGRSGCEAVPIHGRIRSKKDRGDKLRCEHGTLLRSGGPEGEQRVDPHAME